ncbi:thiol-disulfide oxidoreductase DCC family protein [Halohasta salina]|uniref:thiol-disulfide oxidoreductase DCC family protein n=1 Tax=Halohasta salina TaxID=2961621 RepID=UPI0020A473E6|nr:thiol-disulfide oxidoreductase DCC family protein [Halohasta salina]
MTTTEDALAESDEHPILLFDGVCNLCDGSIQFLIPRDPAGTLRFAPLQSDLGKTVREATGLSTDELETVVFVDDGHAYIKSDAAIRIGERLGGIYRLLSLGRLLPRPLRDRIYDFVADHRYDWFGKKDQCMVPDADVSDRFLQ